MTETIATIQISRQMRECIQRCTDCHDVCTETITYCVEQGGAYVVVDLARLRLSGPCGERRDHDDGQGEMVDELGRHVAGDHPGEAGPPVAGHDHVRYGASGRELCQGLACVALTERQRPVA
jgi:hypothetical protein